jgi:peptide/nickel transport system permease protein
VVRLGKLSAKARKNVWNPVARLVYSVTWANATGPPAFYQMKLIIQRLGQGFVVLCVVSLVTFAMLSAAGGDALAGLEENPQVSAATISELRRVYGLDQPWPVRYGRWLGQVGRGTLGVSTHYRVAVGHLLWPRVGRTAALAALALMVAWVVALGLGGWAARRPGGWPDKLCDVLILAASSAPRIALALVVLALVVTTGLAPVGTRGGAVQWGVLWQPALVLSVPLTALFLAQAREGLRAAFREDFVRAARAKGLSESAVLLRHALRAALNPLITLSGTAWGNLMSGSLVAESVFNWPGLGALSVEAVQNRDVPMLLGAVFVITLFVLAGNLLADCLLLLNDPRLRKG